MTVKLFILYYYDQSFFKNTHMGHLASSTREKYASSHGCEFKPRTRGSDYWKKANKKLKYNKMLQKLNNMILGCLKKSLEFLFLLLKSQRFIIVKDLQTVEFFF